MNQRTIAIAAVLMAAVLAGLFATSPLAYAEDRDRDNGRDNHDDDNGRDNHDDDNGRDNHDDDNGRDNHDDDNGRDNHDDDNGRDNHDGDKGGDESETSTDQSVKQKNVGSGDSQNFNCGQNLIKAGVGAQCGEDEILPGITEEATTAPPTLTLPEPLVNNPLFNQDQ